MKNRNCEVSFPPKYWDNISPEALQLTKSLLEREPEQRLSASQALEHVWFSNILESHPLKQTTENIRRYNLEVQDPKLNPELSLLTCTPVLAGRKLGTGPDSPFWGATPQRSENTPMMQMRIMRIGGEEQKQEGAI